LPSVRQRYSTRDAWRHALLSALSLSVKQLSLSKEKKKEKEKRKEKSSLRRSNLIYICCFPSRFAASSQFSPALLPLCNIFDLSHYVLTSRVSLQNKKASYVHMHDTGLDYLQIGVTTFHFKQSILQSREEIQQAFVRKQQ
jgi:hypothetical protein